MKSIVDTKKPKRGRPQADTEAVNLRLNRDLIGAVDAFRRDLEELPNRPEAIRLLLKEALVARRLLND